MDLTGYIYTHAYVYVFSIAVNISDQGVLQKNPLVLTVSEGDVGERGSRQAGMVLGWKLNACLQSDPEL